MNNRSQIIVALDYSSEKQVFDLVDRIEPSLCRLKVGKELFTSCGPDIVSKLVHRGFDVFLDLKFHDIPNTVANACRAAADLGVWMMNVHALGGRNMMASAMESVRDAKSANGEDILLIAVTWLTSSGQVELDALGIPGTPQDMVLRLASMVDDAGLHGVVCSAQEATELKRVMHDRFILVTPGIRLSDPESSVTGDDQCRIVTPEKAISDGASYLVIGRPVTQSDDPCKVLRTINSSIG